MHTLSSTHVNTLTQLVEYKILCMSGADLAEAKEIHLLQSCRDKLQEAGTLNSKHLERLIDLVEIRILCAATEGDGDPKEFATLKACREALLEDAAARPDVTVIPFPEVFLLDDAAFVEDRV